MTTTIRRDHDPERDRCEDARAEHEASREEERRAWVRFTAATVQMTLAQMALMVGPVQETVDLYRKAEAESEAAMDALAKCGVDVTKYLDES